MKKINEIIKMAAFDVDGTILPNGHMQFSTNTKKIFPLLKLNGITSVVATAREFATIGDFLEQLEPDYFIGANGAFIWDVNKKEFIYKNTLKKEQVVMLYNEFVDKVNAFSVCDYDKVFKTPSMQLTSWFVRPFGHNYYDFDESQLGSDDLYVITINSDDPRTTSNMVEKFINDNNLDMVISARWTHGFFIGPKNIEKSYTLGILAEKLGYKMENLIAFGDSSNDYEMLREAGIGVAMERANERIKSVANTVALDCEYDGAYLKLKELGLI
ncbi:HAD family phosphatase [Mycoplasma sp. Pen4]|uniref:YcsE-related riboflavin metabolism phosphatase n=1 Tax=Mycoplasma sp. Pen4 TaxID=640330 RepID=UPI001653FF38|nr:HAD family hydrolase [Mycoplasma sp. Pen4]QNM93401.1 HAD family phosphatase [Mycoplasma sp. Pen4]